MDTHRSLRILVHCGGSYVSGMEIAALSVMKGLDTCGHTVRCVVNAWNDGDFPERLNEADILYDELYLGKVSVSLSPKYLWWTLNALAHLPQARYRYRKLLDAYDPDIIVFHGFGPAFLLYPLYQDYPQAFHIHELPSDSRQFQFVLNRNPDALYIAVSNYIARQLTNLGVSDEQVQVIHNGIEVGALLHGEDVLPNASPTSDGSEPHEMHIGIVGQIGSWKGHEDLLEALDLLQETSNAIPPHVCHVAGTGDSAFIDHLKQEARRRGVADCVRWHGYVQDISEIYRVLDVLVVPSRHGEPFGLVAAEAGLWKTPVIASNSGGLPEVIEDGKTGFLVPEGDPAAIADRLQALLTSADLRRKMGEAAHNRVTGQFTAEAMVRGVDQAINYFLPSHSSVQDTSSMQTPKK